VQGGCFVVKNVCCEGRFEMKDILWVGCFVWEDIFYKGLIGEKDDMWQDVLY
jgi:hypothetical protein